MLKPKTKPQVVSLGRAQLIREADFGSAPDTVLVKNLSSGLSFILNKSAIRQHLAIGGALVVEKLVFFFPDEEMTRQALGISRPAR